jgi:hypothetical protein
MGGVPKEPGPDFPKVIAGLKSGFDLLGSADASFPERNGCEFYEPSIIKVNRACDVALPEVWFVPVYCHAVLSIQY